MVLAERTQREKDELQVRLLCVRVGFCAAAQCLRLMHLPCARGMTHPPIHPTVYLQERYAVLLSEKQAVEAKLDPDAVDQQVGGVAG